MANPEQRYCRTPLARAFNKAPLTCWHGVRNAGDGLYDSGMPDAFVTEGDPNWNGFDSGDRALNRQFIALLSCFTASYQRYKAKCFTIVKQLYALTFGIGAACVGAAGCMLLLIFDVTPSVGPAYTLLAFVIVITGGLGSMPGAIVGGVLIGLTEAIAGLLFTPSAKSMFVFAILVIVLLVRPQGIMGKRAA